MLSKFQQQIEIMIESKLHHITDSTISTLINKITKQIENCTRDLNTQSKLKCVQLNKLQQGFIKRNNLQIDSINQNLTSLFKENMDLITPKLDKTSRDLDRREKSEDIILSQMEKLLGEIDLNNDEVCVLRDVKRQIELTDSGKCVDILRRLENQIDGLGNLIGNNKMKMKLVDDYDIDNQGFEFLVKRKKAVERIKEEGRILTRIGFEDKVKKLKVDKNKERMRRVKSLFRTVVDLDKGFETDKVTICNEKAGKEKGLAKDKHKPYYKIEINSNKQTKFEKPLLISNIHQSKKSKKTKSIRSKSVNIPINCNEKQIDLNSIFSIKTKQSEIQEKQTSNFINKKLNKNKKKYY